MRKEHIKELTNHLLTDYKIFFNFFKSQYRFYHNSNFFRRDLEYAVKRFLELKGEKLNTQEIQFISNEFSEHFEKENIFIKINNNTWRLEYPEFITAQPQEVTV